jgi:toxin ParE1/3/4
MKLIVQIEAEEDLRKIGAYTLDQWGVTQAIHYIDQIETAFLKLLDSPRMGLACNDVRPGYRKWLIEKHVIFYVATETTLTVIRILDQRADAEEQLQ